MSCLQMILYEQNNGLPSNLSFTFDFGKNLSNLDYHSIALNDNENYLLLVANHELQFINFDTFPTSATNAINDDTSIILPCSSHIELVPLFDACNVNRPIVQWNNQGTNQYALAIDRVVRFYNVHDRSITETNCIIDTQHQRPISTISYWPRDPYSLLTGSLDGQVQVWDIRHCSSKTPASLKFSVSTPFSVRHIQWSSNKSDKTNSLNDSNQLAVHCDRCVRIYDMRRPDRYLCSIEHGQRLISIDWTNENRSIVTLSVDNSMRVFSTDGTLLAESIPNEQLPFALSKIRTTTCDSLFICASRDAPSSTYGFTGWRWDEDHYLRPLTDGILSTSPSPINDFALVKDPRWYTLFAQLFASCPNAKRIKHFPILAWCRDGKLRLIDMDVTFRQTWRDHKRMKLANPSDSTIVSKSSSASSLFRQRSSRRSVNRFSMDVIEDQTTDAEESDLDDSTFSERSSLRFDSIGSSETADESDLSMTFEGDPHSMTEVSVQNEFKSLLETYGPHVFVEMKDEQRRMCVLRCTCPSVDLGPFHVYLFLSRHYPTISQLSVRFQVSYIHNTDERFKLIQTRMQAIFDETSNKCFYHGQLCLHLSLLRIQHFFNAYSKQIKLFASAIPNQSSKKRQEESANSSDLDSPNGIDQNYKNSTRISDQSLSPTQICPNQVSNSLSVSDNRRTCGARFGGGAHLVCFGRKTNSQQQQEPTSAPPILNNVTNGCINRSAPLHMRSISLTVTKSRGSSGADEQPSSYRSSTTITNTIQTQHVPTNPRTTIFSAPVRSSLGSSVLVDHQRISTSCRRSLSHYLSQTNSKVSVYDISILLPISRKLGNEYQLNMKNLIKTCEINHQLTKKMAKYELAHCWHLLSGLLKLQSSLSDDHTWFQTPIAQGLIKHIVSHYVTDGDIQSASIFLLTMLKTPYLKTRMLKDHQFDPILYAYSGLLHRWKHFYKRTQVLQEIDYNCQSSIPTDQTPSSITCSICLQPVIGQQFLCTICAHGGHLVHMHGWFSSSEPKHRYCPEKDCTCRCIVKQQELLTMNTDQTQKHPHTPTLTPKVYSVRTSSVSIHVS